MNALTLKFLGPVVVFRLKFLTFVTRCISYLFHCICFYCRKELLRMTDEQVVMGKRR